MTNRKGKKIVDEKTAQRFNIKATAAHFLAYMATERIGVKIYNATIGGELNIYPRVDFYELLGG